MAPRDEVQPLSLGKNFIHKKYPSNRDAPVKSYVSWLQGKQADDDVGPYWRIQNKLYDLTDFVDKHPGGRDWIEATKGTDITEAFESSHFGNKPEQLLPKYFVKDIDTPRIHPYTFNENGFYRTFKRKVYPVLQKVGRGPSWSMVLIQDGLGFSFILTCLLAAWTESYSLAIISGVLLSMTGIAAHNFFHQRDCYRRYWFDFTFLSSYEWRITHGISHHLHPNTVYDFELSFAEPLLNLMPEPSKNFVQRYGGLVYCHLIFPLFFYIEGIKRFYKVVSGIQKLRPENLILILQLVSMMYLAPNYGAGLGLWLIVQMAAGLWFIVVGLVAGHHHPEIYHEGDNPNQDNDWALLQLSAVRDRKEISGNLFLVATTFGDHALHHLLPTVDHSKLHYCYPVFLETCKQFNVPFELVPQTKLISGFYQQVYNISPNPSPPSYRVKSD